MVDLEAWPDLEPVDQATDVLPFPTEVFPPALQSFVKEVSHAMCCPEDFVGVPMLLVAGVAIGDSRVLRLREDWVEAANLWGGIIGPSGTTKSPPINTTVAPLSKAQERFQEQHRQQMTGYEEQLEKWNAAAPDDRGPKPEKPVLRRTLTTDSTMEALGGLLNENSRGLLIHRDELLGWIRSLDQYRGGRGSDRQNHLSAWQCQQICIDRRGNAGPIIIPKPFYTILGSMVPDALGNLRDERDVVDGFLERFLVCLPIVVPAEEMDGQRTIEENSVCLEADNQLAPGLGCKPHGNIYGEGQKGMEELVRQPCGTIERPRSAQFPQGRLVEDDQPLRPVCSHHPAATLRLW